MDSELIINSESDHATIISEGITAADQVVICVAFLKKSGLALIRNSLEAALKKGATVKIVVGTDFFLTEPDALQGIFDLCAPHQKNASLFLCETASATFHPKIYYWSKNGTAQVIVGSANLTAGGLKENIEVSVLHTLQENSEFTKKLLSFVAELENDERVCRVTFLDISRYRRKYEIYRRKLNKAEKEAKKEVESLFSFDEKKLKKYLKEYSLNKGEQGELKEKRANYKKAKSLLDKLATEEIRSKEDFSDIYEKLVGSQDSRALWHSGGLFRSKNKVAEHYEHFIEMLKMIRSNLNSADNVLFDKCRQHAQQIEGLGPNVITEIMNTYAPEKFAVLNNNPASSLSHLGFEEFGSLNKKFFSGNQYAKFNGLIREIARLCKFSDLAEVDHFLNYVYWNHAKPKKG